MVSLSGSNKEGNYRWYGKLSIRMVDYKGYEN